MSDPRGKLFAGAAKVDITPEKLTGLTNLWRTPFTGVHDNIFIRALMLDNGVTSGLIISADLVEFGDTSLIREQIEKELGIPFSNIIITASHDHNAPRVGGVTPGATAQKGGPATEQYTLFVYQCIMDAVHQAKRLLQPASIGIGKGHANVNVNRDIYTPEGWILGANPDRPSDKTAWVIQVMDESGNPISILMNYAVHSVSIGAKNTLVTGDLAGAVERYVEEYFDSKPVVLWTLGPAGDQNPRFMGWDEMAPLNSDEDSYETNQESSYRIMDTLASILGEEVIRTTERIHRFKSEVYLGGEERNISLPARIPPRDAKRKGMEVTKVDSLDIKLGLLMIDHIAFCWVSGEIATNIYWHLRDDSPFTNTILATIANDRVGYIVDDLGYDVPTFSSTASPFQRGFAEKAIVDNLLDMMSKH